MIYVTNFDNPTSLPDSKVHAELPDRPEWTCCQYCSHDDGDTPCCNAVLPADSPYDYVCTMPVGHEGPHRACGYRPGKHPVVMWTPDVTPAEVTEALRASGRPV